MAEVESAFGRLDVLVLNAARAPFKETPRLLERDLRQLVETSLAKDCAYLRDPLVVLFRPNRFPVGLRVDRHATKFQNFERQAAFPYANLAIQDRCTDSVLSLDCRCDYQHQRRHNEKQD